MYRITGVVSIFMAIFVACIVNAQPSRFPGYDAELWKNIDERLQEVDLDGICVLPFEAEEHVVHAEPYRDLIESRLIRLHDRNYNVVCRELDEIETIIDNWELEMSDLFKQSTTARIGEFLGVKVVVMGSIWKHRYSTGAYGHLRFIDVESGQLLFAEQIYFTNPLELTFPDLFLKPFPTEIEADQIYFWEALDEAMGQEAVQKICVLPVHRTKRAMFYRRQMEMELTKLEDYKYQVLVRNRMDIEELIEVREFDMSDLVDPNSAARIGRMIGADAVVLFEFDDEQVIFQIIYTKTARILFKGAGEKDYSRCRAVWKEKL